MRQRGTTKTGDFYEANKKAGFVDVFSDKAPIKIIDGEPVQYVWHHLDDMHIDKNGDVWCTMQLVEEVVYTRISGMAHPGSTKQYECYKNVKYQ